MDSYQIFESLIMSEGNIIQYWKKLLNDLKESEEK